MAPPPPEVLVKGLDLGDHKGHLKADAGGNPEANEPQQVSDRGAFGAGGRGKRLVTGATGVTDVLTEIVGIGNMNRSPG